MMLWVEVKPAGYFAVRPDQVGIKVEEAAEMSAALHRGERGGRATLVESTILHLAESLIATASLGSA